MLTSAHFLYSVSYQHALCQWQVGVDEAGMTMANPFHKLSCGRIYQLIVSTCCGESDCVWCNKLQLCCLFCVIAGL